MTLEAWRRSQSLSYGRIAALLGCSRSQAYRLCHGAALPDREMMKRIGAATGHAVGPDDVYADPPGKAGPEAAADTSSEEQAA